LNVLRKRGWPTLERRFLVYLNTRFKVNPLGLRVVMGEIGAWKRAHFLP